MGHGSNRTHSPSMCGIVGFLWAPGARVGRNAEGRVRDMARAIAHRGPDSDGTWTDDSAGVALGHRRLAIVDLSPAGHQPMASPAGRYVMVYNGEVYDHADLRAELETAGKAPQWRGTSDTESLVAAFDAWGIAATIARCSGMFALAVWDKADRRLTLVRDRFGEKPLYYGWNGTGEDRAFYFASELRALRAHPAFAPEIDGGELPHYARTGYIRVGHSIYRGIRQVRPGEIVQLGAGQTDPTGERYWDAAAVAHQARTEDGFTGSDDEALHQLEALTSAAVERQMMADVPLGAFLSGGIDSSTVVALMQRQSRRPIHTFAIGFHEARYNEATHAKAIAQHLGTDHTELYVGEGELLGVVPDLAGIFDEPFADSSQIPTFLVSRLARQAVTVALSGDGGDELFGGYDRYRKGARLFDAIGRVPLPLRKGAAGAIRALSPAVLDRMLAPVRRVPQGKEPNGQWAHRLATYAASADVDALHRALVSQTQRADRLTAAAEGPEEGPVASGSGLTAAERMMQLDLAAYLPGYILTKVDRAAMAVSLESRAPLLDHRLAEFALSLPERMKVRGPTSKWLLRRLCTRLLPSALVERPKMGFEVPMGLWLRGPLSEWAGDLLAPDAIRRDGWFDAAEVTRMWSEHRNGRFNHGLGLWHVLMFQAWRSHLQGPPH
ncbi:MAG: asparagine synthase (glutamine-hydrolyzing) [Pseudomonadota bacterium]